MYVLSHFLSVLSHFLGLWLVKNIIVIEVEVDKLHEGKILSRPSTSMEIKEIKRGWTELCHTWNHTKNKEMSPLKFTYSGRICRFAQFLSKIRQYNQLNPQRRGQGVVESNLPSLPKSVMCLMVRIVLGKLWLSLKILLFEWKQVAEGQHYTVNRLSLFKKHYSN